MYFISFLKKAIFERARLSGQGTKKKLIRLHPSVRDSLCHSYSQMNDSAFSLSVMDSEDEMCWVHSNRLR